MQRVSLNVVLVIVGCATSQPKVVEQFYSANQKTDTCDAKLTELLKYHKGSVPELQQQVADNIEEIKGLKSEILHAENTLKLVSDSADVAKKNEQTLLNTNEKLLRQLMENGSSDSNKISNILSVTTDIYNKLGSAQCDTLQKEIKVLKTDLSTAKSTNKQLSDQLEKNLATSNVQQAKVSLPLMQIGQGYYYYAQQSLDWYSAMRFCRQHGLSLISLETREEFEAVTAHALKNGFQNNWELHTSGTDFGSHGHWYWASTGKSLTFNTWLPGEPGPYNERIIMIRNRNNVMGFEDRHADLKKYFYCELLN